MGYAFQLVTTKLFVSALGSVNSHSQGLWAKVLNLETRHLPTVPSEGLGSRPFSGFPLTTQPHSLS